ncbi:MAG: quinone oxidoreductase family protein [Acidimicrobiales bacterium]
MRIIEIDRFGGPEVLELRDRPDLEPPDDGYVVQVMAAGLNYADIVERRGRYKKDQPLPGLLGKEAAGIVVARGPVATRFELGDPVIVVRFSNGCYAEQVAARPHEVLRPPSGLSFVEMAAFATNYATAWWAMHEIARVRPGEPVLVHAAAGGVGTAAVELARTAGCGPIIGTAGGPEKCAAVRERGADACVDYLRDDFRPVVRELTDGAGVAYCLESVGGETYDRSLEALAPMGSLVIIGFSSIDADYAEVIPRLHPLSLFHRSISVGGLNIDNLAFQRRADIWGRLVDHAEQHQIRPDVRHVFPFEEIRTAHDLLGSRRSIGKVVLTMDPAAHDTGPVMVGGSRDRSVVAGSR